MNERLLALSIALAGLWACQKGIIDVPANALNPELGPGSVVIPGGDVGPGSGGDSDDNGSGDDDNGTNPGDSGNEGCLSDRLEPPADGNCTCVWDDCDATSMTCECDLECFGEEDCMIGVDADGNPVTSDGFLGDCQLSCTPEDDLSEEMSCSVSDCEIVPEVIDINPTVAPAPPSTTSVDAQRDITEVDVVFVVDNSASMADNQMAAACALDAFYDEAGQNGGSYQAGVLTTDMTGDRDAPGGTYDLNTREYLAPPGLMQAEPGCDTIVSCNGACEADVDTSLLCDFTNDGDFVASDEAGSQEALQQAIVQGDDGSNYEGGLEQAFQFFAEQERRGEFDWDTPKEVVVISDEDADGDYTTTTYGAYHWMCPFDSVERNTEDIPNFDPPPAQNTDASCKQDLANFYIYYFTSRNIVVHGLLYGYECAHDSTESAGIIYSAVIEATGGVEQSICECGSFDEFFGDVGAATSTASTEMCFDGTAPDPSTIEVTHVDSGEVVPQSATNGWTFEAGLQWCIVMHGTWLDRYGDFHVEYLDPDAPPPVDPDPTACLPPGVEPLLDTMVLVCDGVVVPNNPTNGYQFDPYSDCFTFHGSYADAVDCTLEYL